jgi:hypothetical protein
MKPNVHHGMTIVFGVLGLDVSAGSVIYLLDASVFPSIKWETITNNLLGSND